MQSKAVIVLEDGSKLQRWCRYAIDSDFLTAADGFEAEFDAEWPKVKELVQPDRKIQIFIDGVLQCTGWIDAVDVESVSESGTRIMIQGRDVMRSLVRAHMHPQYRCTKRTLIGMVEEVIAHAYHGNAPTVFYSNAANVNLVTGGSTSSTWVTSFEGEGKGAGKNLTLPGGKPLYLSHEQEVKTIVQTPVAGIKPSQGETCWAFLSRQLVKHGLWMWSTANGSLVVGRPNYDGAPAYLFRRRRGDPYPYIKRVHWSFDRTEVPSHIFVTGVSNVATKPTQQVSGSVELPGWKFWAPRYLKADHGNTPSFCRQLALQEMNKARQREEVYSCTVAGHRCPVSGHIYALDTMAAVEDEFLGLSQDYYVKRRTFKMTVTGGTTTDLELVPRGAIRFSDVDSDKKGK